MKLKDYVITTFKLFSTDETLLRLLIYKPDNPNDNPLDKNKPNILDMDEIDRANLIKDRIIMTPSTDKLEDDPMCRVVIRTGKRKSNNKNYKFASQEMIFDVLAHKDFNDVDVRCNWICDQIGELLFEKRIIGANELKTMDGSPLTVGVKNYIGYSISFDVGSVN